MYTCKSPLFYNKVLSQINALTMINVESAQGRNMKKQIKVTFKPKNSKCVSLKEYSYTIVTECELKAEIVARGLLEQDTGRYELYRPYFSDEVAYLV